MQIQQESHQAGNRGVEMDRDAIDIMDQAENAAAAEEAMDFVDDETTAVLSEGAQAALNGQEPDINDVKMEDVITMTARLAQILAQEADYLEEMQISAIQPLQKEKKLLTDALATLKKQINKHPEILQQIDEQTYQDLKEVITIFNQVLEENYKRLNMARSVNEKVVEAISDVVREHNIKSQYDQHGQSGGTDNPSVSLSLNEKI